MDALAAIDVFDAASARPHLCRYHRLDTSFVRFFSFYDTSPPRYHWTFHDNTMNDDGTRLFFLLFFFSHNIAMHCDLPLCRSSLQLDGRRKVRRRFCMALGVKERARYREWQGGKFWCQAFPEVAHEKWNWNIGHGPGPFNENSVSQGPGWPR